MADIDLHTLLTILALGLITVITRGFFLLSDRPWTLPHWAQRGLQYAPIAALSAVVLPEIVTSHGQLVQTWMDARLFAAAAGASHASPGASPLRARPARASSRLPRARSATAHPRACRRRSLAESDAATARTNR